MPLHIYLPQDRLRALAKNTPLSDCTSGAALFADISGFTALTEALRDGLGPRRGAEELTRRMEAVYSTLIGEIERHVNSLSRDQQRPVRWCVRSASSRSFATMETWKLFPTWSGGP